MADANNNPPNEVTFLPVAYPDFDLSPDKKSVTRVQESSKGVLYLSQPLRIGQKVVFRVRRVNKNKTILVDDEDEEEEDSAKGLTIGLTTCNRRSIEDHLFHLLDICRPGLECGGKSLTISIPQASEGNEISIERRAGVLLQVRVNGVLEYSLQDLHGSTFRLCTPRLIPFVMLSGEIESLELLGVEKINLIPDVIPLTKSKKKEPIIQLEKLPNQNVNQGQAILFKCAVCRENMITHMAIPCNHAAYCQDCKMHLSQMPGHRNCSVCNHGVTGYVRIYLN